MALLGERDPVSASVRQLVIAAALDEHHRNNENLAKLIAREVSRLF